MKRIPWIDTAKGLGIIMVILGHAGVPEWMKTTISTFHMPLFFLLSGFLFNYQKYQGLPMKFSRQKFTRLIFPFFFSFLLLSTIWIVIKTIVTLLKVPYQSPIFNLSVNEIIGSLIYGNGASTSPLYSSYALMVDPPLWFLPALFCSLLILYMVVWAFSNYGVLKGVIICIFIILIGWILGMFFYLPWGLDVACIAIVFTGTGYLIRQQNFTNQYLTPINILALMLAFCVCVCINGCVDMNTRHYQNLIIFYIGGVAGSLLTIYISMGMESFSRICSSFKYLGSISLFIMVFHVPLMVFCIGPLQVLYSDMYVTIQDSWLTWFSISLLLCIGGWQIASRILWIKKLYK